MVPKSTVIQSGDLREKWELFGWKKGSSGQGNSIHKSCYSLQTERSQVRFQSRACTLVAGTSPLGDVQEAADQCFSLINVSNSLSLSLPLFKKSIKCIFLKKSYYPLYEESIWMEVGVVTKAYAHYTILHAHTHTHLRIRRTIKILIDYFQFK
uniref:Uncharacterized protein n=1 Tax=Pipistrellus kuhlii TaxID=59472 RepID=A0A7J7XBX4_PIPKU|nr:hypothetical protein mPipKuh1_010584 [Pipistrellus kuhlii]